MDLPASVFLGLMDRDDGAALAEPEKPAEKKDTPPADPPRMKWHLRPW